MYEHLSVLRASVIIGTYLAFYVIRVCMFISVHEYRNKSLSKYLNTGIG